MQESNQKSLLKELQTQDDVKDVIYDSKPYVQVYQKLLTIKKYQTQVLEGKINEEILYQKFRNKQTHHLVRIHKVWSNNSHTFVAMNYYPYNLSEYLQENYLKLRDKPYLVISLILQIIYGLVELGVTHRDLKLNNILIKDLGQDSIEVVLTDFQSCNKGQMFNKSVIGTQLYMAPQIKYKRSSQPYNKKVDIWSLSLIMFQICSIFQNKSQQNQRFPQFPYEFQKRLKEQFFNKQDYQNFENFLQQNGPIINQKVPQILRLIMFRTLVFAPQQRWSLEKILSCFESRMKQLLSYFPEQKKKSVQQQFRKYHEMYLPTVSEELNNTQKIQEFEQMYSLYRKLQNQTIENKSKVIYKGVYLLKYCVLQSILNKYNNLIKKKVAKQHLLQQFLLIKGKKGFKNIQQLKVKKIQLKIALQAKYKDLSPHYNKFQTNPRLLFQSQIINQNLRQYYSVQKINSLVKLFTKIQNK